MLWSPVSELPSTPPSSQSLTTQAGELAQPCPAQGIPEWERDHNTTLEMHKAGGVGSVRRERAPCLQSRPERAVRDLWGHLGYAKLCFPFYLCCLEGGRSSHSKHGADHDTVRLAWKSDEMDLTCFWRPQPLHLQGMEVTQFSSIGSRDPARREVLQQAPKGEQVRHTTTSLISALLLEEPGW